MDTDSKDDRKTRKVKKQVRKGDLPIVSGTSSLDASSKTALTEKESAMVIYDLRAKLDEQYAEHGSEEEKSEIRAKLESTEVCYGHFSYAWILREWIS
jgi:heat shock protein 4